MLDFLKNELAKFEIELVCTIPLSECNVIRPYKLKNAGLDESCELSVIIFAIPYYTKQKGRNISAYAIPRDYHHFARLLFDGLIPKLCAKYPQYKFAGFADNSPIGEVHAAAMSGLGILGDNMMLITEKYSSYIFLGEIITDHPLPRKDHYEIKGCRHCGLCRASCPMGEIGECLSALTQKKGELSKDEKKHLVSHGSAWGCDICSEVCPYTEAALKNGTIYSPIEFFNRQNTPMLTSELINSMSDEQFSQRAYSWRGREIILRNLKLLETYEKGGDS